jgi:predicted unusual protein kinase regulating ubiquinone biosynthesis (AarF/ABC1/UbiB family)
MLIAPGVAPRWFCRWLLRLGPVYVKLAQVMSTRADVFSPAWRKELAQLRTAVPPMPDRALQRVIKASFPQGVNRVFAQFTQQSLAAGTVAQVHRATLHDGTPVAVKILRPGVGKRIAQNFRVLEMGANIAMRLSRNLRAANLSGMVAELKRLLLSQVDLCDERDNYLEFARVFANERDVTVPKVYPDLSSHDVLVTEFVDAIAPDDFAALNIPPLALARRMDSLMDTMVFIHGLLHADLHPGNFFWDREGRVVLIDLGLVHRLPRLDRNHIMTFYLSIVDGYYDFAAEYFVHYLVEDALGDISDERRKAAISDACGIIHEQYVATAGRPKMNQIFERLLNILARHRLRLRAGYTNIFLTLTTVEGYIYALDPSFDMIDNARAKRIDDMEYTTVPDEAVKLIVGEHGSYSTARYNGAVSLDAAYQERNRYLLDDMLRVQADRFLIDVGCGRGIILRSAGERGARATGITISKFERDVCHAKGLDAVHCSWENFEALHGKDYPLADYVTAMEVLSHLGSVHENKVGLVRVRLSQFFDWLHKRVVPGGRVLLQEMMVTHEFLHGAAHVAAYTALTEELPWSGFTVLADVRAAAERYFDIEQCLDHSSDIVPTYDALLANFDANVAQLDTMVRPHVREVVRREMESYRKFAREGHIALHRIVLVHRQQAAG